LTVVIAMAAKFGAGAIGGMAVGVVVGVAADFDWLWLWILLVRQKIALLSLLLMVSSVEGGAL
jgi:hypothetical protein